MAMGRPWIHVKRGEAKREGIIAVRKRGADEGGAAGWMRGDAEEERDGICRWGKLKFDKICGGRIIDFGLTTVGSRCLVAVPVAVVPMVKWTPRTAGQNQELEGCFMLPPAHIHPHDLGLPAAIIRKRRRARYTARWMLFIAGVTAITGWTLYGTSFFFALRWPQRPTDYGVLAGYALLIVSSVTLILGLWSLLLAQVHRIARLVDADEVTDSLQGDRCGNCGWPHDPPDRFCRHCGKPLAAHARAVTARTAAPQQ